MNHHPADLDAFETSLLAELRAVAHHQGAARLAPPPRAAQARRSRRAWYVSLAGAVAATLAIALVVTLARPAPAYAISGRNGQKVVVTVTRLEGARGLENALAQRGIAAQVTYLPSDTACQEDRYDEADPHGLALSVGANMFKVTIPAGAVGQGETFVLSAAVTPLDGGAGVRAAVSYGIARGAIDPCVPVAAS